MSQEQFPQDPISDEEAKKPDRRRLIIYIVLGVLAVCLLCSIVYIFVPRTSDDGEEIAGVTSAPTEAIDEELPPEETPLPIEPQPPTNTPEPTDTPLPTATPTPIPSPTPIPDPVVLSGSGDSVVDFENPFDISIAHITGNAGSRHFSVKSYESTGDSYELLVNTTDPYEGTVLLDVAVTHTTRFEIAATGEWTIIVDSVINARELIVPGIIEGNGDDVIILREGTPDLAHIKGNEQARHFSVKGYGSSSDLIVNTTDPYEGTVILASDTILLEISATGAWSIEVTE